MNAVSVDMLRAVAFREAKYVANKNITRVPDKILYKKKTLKKIDEDEQDSSKPIDKSVEKPREGSRDSVEKQKETSEERKI